MGCLWKGRWLRSTSLHTRTPAPTKVATGQSPSQALTHPATPVWLHGQTSLRTPCWAQCRRGRRQQRRRLPFRCCHWPERVRWWRPLPPAVGCPARRHCRWQWQSCRCYCWTPPTRWRAQWSAARPAPRLARVAGSTMRTAMHKGPGHEDGPGAASATAGEINRGWGGGAAARRGGGATGETDTGPVTGRAAAHTPCEGGGGGGRDCKMGRLSTPVDLAGWAPTAMQSARGREHATATHGVGPKSRPAQADTATLAAPAGTRARPPPSNPPPPTQPPPPVHRGHNATATPTTTSSPK